MRHASDAIMTGIGTVLADDPLLTDRTGLPRRRRLLRVVLDSRLRLSPSSQLVRTADNDVVVTTSGFYTLKATASKTGCSYQLDFANFEAVTVAAKSTVWPTISGVIVDRRDHVLISLFSPLVFMSFTFFMR